jgi:opacity protein-like surface antigen
MAAAAQSAARAQSPTAQTRSWEVSGFIGYTPSADLDRRASDLEQLDIRGGFTWGAQAARLFGPNWAAEAMWTEHSSALQIGTSAGTADLFLITTGQVQGNAVYHFGRADAKLRPFAFAGIGATFVRADDIPSETKFSWGLGGGIKYFAWENLGLRAHFRYKPVSLNDEDAGDFCDPFGFCQGTMQQIEFAAGAIVRF